MLTGRLNPYVTFSRIFWTYGTSPPPTQISLRKTFLECYFTTPSIQIHENYITNIRYGCLFLLIYSLITKTQYNSMQTFTISRNTPTRQNFIKRCSVVSDMKGANRRTDNQHTRWTDSVIIYDGWQQQYVQLCMGRVHGLNANTHSL